MTEFLADRPTAAADRFFRLYAGHCRDPDEDSLLALLESLHGLNDKLRASEQVDLFASSAFIALKALRNLFHHEAELVHQVRLVPVSRVTAISTDLLIMCLVRRELVEHAFAKLDDQQRDVARTALKWYGDIVNLQPCLFNVAVDIYELLLPLKLQLQSDGFEEFRESYEFETAQGFSHRVSGDIICRAGDVETLLQAIFEGSP